MKAIGVILAFVLLAGVCLADEILLKDGRKLNGYVVSETEADQSILLESGAVMTLKKDEVKEIKPTPSPEKVLLLEKYELDKKAKAAKTEDEKQDAARGYNSLARKYDARAEEMKGKAEKLRQSAAILDKTGLQPAPVVEKPSSQDDMKPPVEKQEAKKDKVWTLAELKAAVNDIRPIDPNMTHEQDKNFWADLKTKYDKQNFKGEFIVRNVSRDRNEHNVPYGPYEIECDPLDWVNARAMRFTMFIVRAASMDDRAGKIRKGGKITCSGILSLDPNGQAHAGFSLNKVEVIF